MNRDRLLALISSWSSLIYKRNSLAARLIHFLLGAGMITLLSFSCSLFIAFGGSFGLGCFFFYVLHFGRNNRELED